MNELERNLSYEQKGALGQGKAWRGLVPERK